MPPVTGDGIYRSKNPNTSNSEDSTDSDFSTYLKLYATSDHTSPDTRELLQDDTSFSNHEDADPDYVDFLKHLKDYGNAYALEIPQDNGGSELLVYEAPIHEIVEHHPTKGRLRDSLNIINKTLNENKKAKTLGVMNDNLGFEPVEQGDEQHPKMKKKLKKTEQIKEVNLTSGTNLVPRRSLRSNDQTKEPKGSSKVLAVEENSGGEQDLRHRSASVSNGVKGCSNQKRGREATNNIREITDSCYQEFINALHMEDDSIVYVKANGERIRYGECDDVDKDDVDKDDMDKDDMDKDECSSDIEILENHSVPETDNGTHMEGDDDLQWVSNPYKSEFREKLMLELKRPYDQDEYEKLLDDVNEQRAKSMHAVLRPRSIASENVGTSHGKRRKRGYWKDDELAKSYLQSHPDLEKQLKSVQFERPKVLNILRGFFYWLQNLAKEGNFKPWTDPSCLEVMPEIL